MVTLLTACSDLIPLARPIPPRHADSTRYCDVFSQQTHVRGWCQSCPSSRSGVPDSGGADGRRLHRPPGWSTQRDPGVRIATRVRGGDRTAPTHFTDLVSLDMVGVDVLRRLRDEGAEIVGVAEYLKHKLGPPDTQP